MIQDLYVIETAQCDPYHNLALEKALFDHVRDKEMILYLWQNEKTVVIGRNQSAHNECNLSALKEDGGVLARRLSGGGAVYHDTGNLNFTFLSHEENFDTAKQNEVLLCALKKFGLPAEISGRNDLLIQGKKFSGHAYLHHNRHAMHHGTIMLNVNTDALARYLNVSLLKLRDKHVASVRSRVINLKEILPSLTVKMLKEALKEAFAEVYQKECKTLSEEELNRDEILHNTAFFADPAFLFGKEKQLPYAAEERFAFGMLRIEYDLCDNRITDAAVYSDALDTEYLSSLAPKLLGQNIQDITLEATNETEVMMNEALTELIERSKCQ